MLGVGRELGVIVPAGDVIDRGQSVNTPELVHPAEQILHDDHRLEEVPLVHRRRQHGPSLARVRQGPDQQQHFLHASSGGRIGQLEKIPLGFFTGRVLVDDVGRCSTLLQDWQAGRRFRARIFLVNDG